MHLWQLDAVELNNEITELPACPSSILLLQLFITFIMLSLNSTISSPSSMSYLSLHSYYYYTVYTPSKQFILFTNRNHTLCVVRKFEGKCCPKITNFHNSGQFLKVSPKIAKVIFHFQWKIGNHTTILSPNKNIFCSFYFNVPSCSFLFTFHICIIFPFSMQRNMLSCIWQHAGVDLQCIYLVVI